MLVALGLVALVAAQPAAEPSPYRDVVRQYGPGHEAPAIAALHALRLRDADDVLDALDRSLCRSLGARSCQPHHLIAAGPKVGDSVIAAWRRLYPRALALHVDALASCDPIDEAGAMRLHRGIVVRLIARIDQLAREQRKDLAAFTRLGVQGRHLVLWALQYLRDVDGLAALVDRYETDLPADVDVRLARGALAELRALPDAAAQSARTADLSDAFARDNMIASEERRLTEGAAQVYEGLLAAHPAELEARLRLARLLLRLGRAAEAEAHLGRVSRLHPDSRQAYLAALFLADVFERQGRIPDAIAAYGVARGNWPGSQAPSMGLARLRALSGAHDDARAALEAMHLEQPAEAPPRSDPWIGYIGAQSWRLPDALAALQAQFEAEP
jgi:tetratricopeptide (TPR) repeat protein